MLGLAFASSAILLALLLTLVPRVEQLVARGAEDTAQRAAIWADVEQSSPTRP